jgi:hypothetical protein
MRIENLSKELSSKSMKSVVGGDNGNSANNTIGQVMSLSVPVSVLGNGPTNSAVHVNGTQNANICNTQLGGDVFLALFPAFGGVVRA